MLRVLLEPTVAHLHETKLAFDHPKWMLHFGTHPSLELFSLVDQGICFLVFVQSFALAWTHGNVPSDVGLCVRALLNALVACVAKGYFLCAVQQAAALDDVMHIARGASHSVHQARLGICADVNTKGLPASR